MEKYLPYITNIITVLSIVSGAVFSIVKYIDLRNREEKRLNYENLNNILKNLSGTMLENGEFKVEIGFLISNIYQLLEFKDYSEIIIAVLKYYKDCPIGTDQESLKHVNNSVDYVLRKFKSDYLKQNINDGQIATSALRTSSQ